MERHHPKRAERVSKADERKPQACFFCKKLLVPHVRKMGEVRSIRYRCHTEGCPNF